MDLLIKVPLLLTAGGVFLKYIDVIAPLVGVVGSFFYMCGLQTGGLIVRISFAVYLLVKIMSGVV